MPGEGLRARQARARTLVLTGVVASAVMRMIAVTGSLSWIIMGTPMSIESATCVAVTAETLMHQDRGTLPAALWCMVDQHIPAGMPKECVLAGIEFTSSIQ